MSDFFTMRSGETAAPVPDGPVLCQATATMRRVHRVFLWAYSEAPGLARSVEKGDVERVAYVGDALGTFDKLLHVHHEGEDLFMYPRIAERAPACAAHVAQMLEHHAQVGALLDDLTPVRLAWMTSADPELGEDLAQRYEALATVLAVHLRREVTEVTPVVDRVLTEKELAALGGHGIDAFETKVLLAYLGMILAANPPGEREEFFKEAPLPLRAAYRLVGRRLYRKQYTQLFPGREIPATL